MVESNPFPVTLDPPISVINALLYLVIGGKALAGWMVAEPTFMVVMSHAKSIGHLCDVTRLFCDVR